MKKLTEAHVTPEKLFYQRRKVLHALGLSAVGLTLPLSAQAQLSKWFGSPETNASPQRALEYTPWPHTYLKDSLTPEDKVTSYNNFYEFGYGKGDPAANGAKLKTEGWKIEITGEVETPLIMDMDDLLQRFVLEERIYRLRCVEAWSMIIPWLGFELNQLLKLVEPTSQAKFVAFETLYDPEQMPGQKQRSFGGGLNYPYLEALRIDEAMHPLTLMSVGVYGKTLPPQNGAPIRLVVPWKYGFKSIKSIVKIHLTRERPPTTWNLSAPHEYGFYANVNPKVDHPRWSQASERIIGAEGIFNVTRKDTELFNGYIDEVGSLYQGLDLRQNY